MFMLEKHAKIHVGTAIASPVPSDDSDQFAV